MYLIKNEPSHWQMDTKRCPWPRFAPRLGFSAVLFGNPFDESQSKSPPSGCFFLFISSIKRLEETYQLLRWNRGPRIPYFQHNCVSLDLGAQLHFAPPCAVLDGVAREIEEGSLNEVRITLKCGQVRSNFGPDLYLRSLRNRLNDSRNLFDSFAALERFFAHGAGSRLESKHIEISIDHGHQTA